MLAEFSREDVSNSLRAVETAIGIITTTGGDPNTLFSKYLTDVLRMNEDRISSVKVFAVIF